MSDRKSLSKVYIEKYRYASKREKIIMLNEFIEYTGYNRNYATRVLRTSTDFNNPPGTERKRNHTPLYDNDIKIALEKIWGISYYICGKRLVCIIPEMVRKLEKFDEYEMSIPVKEKLKKISAATVDRMLASSQKRIGRRGTSMRESFPFPIQGIHSDNGSEFINDSVLAFAEEHTITFTRGGPYKKNDNPHVEQKNNSILRRNTGYLRYDQPEHAEVLEELYGYLNLYVNYFEPTMILVEKHRVGAKAIRKYDPPRTPYQRVLARQDVSSVVKKKIKKIYRPQSCRFEAEDQ